MNNTFLILILLILIILVIWVCYVFNKEHFNTSTTSTKSKICTKSIQEKIIMNWLYGSALDEHKEIRDICNEKAKIPAGNSGGPYSRDKYRKCVRNRMNQFINTQLMKHRQLRSLSREKINRILAATISKEYDGLPDFYFDKNFCLIPRQARKKE
jgi:hypothetical protein